MKDIDRAWENYKNYVFDKAKQVMFEYIAPWLNKKGYSFIAGNGDWTIIDSYSNIVYEDKLPKYIKKLLYTEIPGMAWNDLGSIMPCIEHKDR